MNTLKDLLADARRQLAYHEFNNADGSVRALLPKAAASAITLSMRSMDAPQPPTPAGMSLIYAPQGTEATRVTKLPLAVAHRSRAVMAGARLFLVDAAVEPVQPTYLHGQAQNAPVALTRRQGRFTVVEPALLAKTDDGDDLSASTIPVFTSDVDMDTMPAYGVHFELTRADMREYNDGELADAALASIVMGIGRVCDAALIAAIVAGTPAAFTIGAAAAKGFEFRELRALIGTTGTGSAVGQDGTLRAAGVLAELTDASASTIIGAWSRSAVAVADDIRLVAERTGKAGDLRLTAWVNVQALTPRPGCFWTVA